jgi:hypothetical protein
MSRTAIFDDPSHDVDGSPDRLIKWGKTFDSGDTDTHSRYSKSDCSNGLLSRLGQLVPGPTSKGMNRHYHHQQEQQQQQQQQHQQLQQQHQELQLQLHRRSSKGGNESTTPKAIANPTSLPPLSFNNYVPSMLVPNSNQNTNHPQAQRQQGHNLSSNNTAWLQHMILNPINPLQNNPNRMGNNAGDNGCSGISNQANASARQQQLQGNIHGNADINFYHQQQVSTQLGHTTIGTSSVATTLSKQQQQTLKQSSLASQQVWPSQGQQQQQQNLQQGLQLNQLLSLQQQQFLPLNELTSQLQLPSARQTQQLQQQQQQQQAVVTSNINQIAAFPTAVSAPPSAQQQQQQFLLLASMLQQDNANNNGSSVDMSALSAALASPEGLRLLQSFLLGQQENQVQQQQQTNRLPHGGSAGTGPAGSGSMSSSSNLLPVSGTGIEEDALSNQQHFFLSQQSQQPQLQSQSQQFHGIPQPMPLLNRTVPSFLDLNRPGNNGESSLGATARNHHFLCPADGTSAAMTRIASPSSRFAIPNISMPADSSSLLMGSKINVDRGSMGFSSSGPSIKSDKNSKGNKTTTANSQFPRVLYCESDDAILGEYQTLLRQQLELFEADSHDVINGTFRQGRTTPIRLGQIGLRCKHCAKTPLSVRTKGSVYCKSKLVFVVSIYILHIS